MSLVGRIPGMREGAIARNVLVGGVYLLAFPLFLALLPVIGAVLVWRNQARLAESLSGLPGISADGGATSGVAAGAYAVIFLALLSAAVLASDDPAESAVDAADDIEDPETELPTTTPDPDEGNGSAADVEEADTSPPEG